MNGSGQILRGTGTVVRLAEDRVVLRRRTEEVAVPVRAVAAARAQGRVFELEVRTPEGREPAVHRVDDVSEAAARAFADAVTARLSTLAPGELPADGTELVVSGPVEAAWSLQRQGPLLLGLLLVFSLAVAVGTSGTAAQGMQTFFAVAGTAYFTAMFVSLMRDYRLLWWLPEHGITVTAELSHLNSRTSV
jgi:hypothetical protein